MEPQDLTVPENLKTQTIPLQVSRNGFALKIIKTKLVTVMFAIN